MVILIDPNDQSEMHWYARREIARLKKDRENVLGDIERIQIDREIAKIKKEYHIEE